MVVEYFERSTARDTLERVDRPRTKSWVHISGRSLNIEGLAREFSLQPNILSDVSDIRELPRAEFADGVEYIFVRLPIGAADNAKTAPLLSALSKQQLITASQYTKFSPLDVDVFMTTDTRQPSSVLPAIIAYISNEYEQRLYTLAEKITSARQRLKSYNVQNADFIEFVAIEDSLNEYRSNLEGLISVLEQLRLNRRQLFSQNDLEGLADITQHSRQLLVAIDSNRKTIDSIQNAYSTIANNTLNQRMKVLTTITILLAIPNVFYGMYGMNVALPFQHQPWAYSAVVGLTLLLILLVYILAKRLRLF